VSSATGDLLVWIDDLDPATAVAVAGSKIGRLAELRRAGITVPAGFAITTGAYDSFCEGTGLDRAVDRRLAAVTDAGDTAALQAASTDILALFNAAAMPRGLAAAITDGYEELSYRCMDLNVPSAVRSSATGEDSAEASFAGQFDTYLGISGADRVIPAVQRCWASLFTARGIGYRLTHGLTHRDSPMAVGVLELVNARASGVAFSIHPVTGKRDRMVIEGSWGWGEAVVQGLVTPDHIEVGKADRRVLRYDVAHKAVVSAFDYEQGRVVETEMPKRLRDEAILDPEQLDAVVQAVLRIEDHYRHPVDVEWVLDRHRRPGEPICVVQTRPETVHTDAAAGQPAAPAWDPVAYAGKYAFGGKPR
jgi:pyruvate,water dikinase